MCYANCSESEGFNRLTEGLDSSQKFLKPNFILFVVSMCFRPCRVILPEKKFKGGGILARVENLLKFLGLIC